MKVQIRVAPRVFVEATGETHIAVFEQMEGLQEVFSCFNKCGKCQSENLKFVKRTQDKHTYYELHCRKCYARLSFGQNDGDKTGSIYPRRKETKKQSVMGGKLEPNDYLPDDGWIRWNKDKQESE